MTSLDDDDDIVLPLAQVARWYRKRARYEAPSTEKRTSVDLEALIATPNSEARRFVSRRIEHERTSQPCVARDARLAYWLELLARCSPGADRPSTLDEAAALLERAIAMRPSCPPPSWFRLRWRLHFLREMAIARSPPERRPSRVAIHVAQDIDAAHLLARSEPFIVRGGAFFRDLSAWTPEALSARLPESAIADIKTSQRGRPTRWAALENSRRARVRDFVAQPDRDGYLHDWSLCRGAPVLLRDLNLQTWLAENELTRHPDYADSWPSLFVGRSGTSSAVHVDANATHFAMALAVGRKRWRIWRPNDVSALAPRFANEDSDDLVFDNEAACEPAYEADQLPGDLLVVPSNSPHAVKNIELSIGVALNFVDASNRDAFQEAWTRHSTSTAVQRYEACSQALRSSL